jgi:hypothetical protein
MHLTALKFYRTVIWLVPEKLGRAVFVKAMLSGLVNVSYGVQRIRVYNFFPSYLCCEDVFRDAMFIMYTQFYILTWQWRQKVWRSARNRNKIKITLTRH